MKPDSHPARNLLQMIRLLVFLLPLSSTAQDSVRYFSESEFRQVVAAFHPVVKLAGLGVQRADAGVLASRGGFDPLLSADASQKEFGGVDYYTYFNPELQIPTWYGVELFAGTEYVAGERTDSEATLGRSGYLGISIPLARDLVLDKRRAALKQAKILAGSSRAEQQSQVNDLMWEAINAYWAWAVSYRVYQVYDRLVELNRQRFEWVKSAFQQGDRAAIDTTEALAQWQSFQLRRSESLLEFQNAGVELSIYLWNRDGSAYELPPQVIPDTSWFESTAISLAIPDLESNLSLALASHPDLVQYRFKLESLSLDRKLKFQQLLPKADLKYHFLGKNYNIWENVQAPLLEKNYRVGITFEMPLRLSEGRGLYRMSGLKIEEARWQQSLKANEVRNKIRSYFNNLLAQREQIRIQQEAYENSLKLLQGEEARFREGESSLFLVNTRENKAYENLEKLIALKGKFFKSLAGFDWASGKLF